MLCIIILLKNFVCVLYIMIKFLVKIDEGIILLINDVMYVM